MFSEFPKTRISYNLYDNKLEVSTKLPYLKVKDKKRKEWTSSYPIVDENVVGEVHQFLQHWEEKREEIGGRWGRYKSFHDVSNSFNWPFLKIGQLKEIWGKRQISLHNSYRSLFYSVLHNDKSKQEKSLRVTFMICHNWFRFVPHLNLL